MVEIWKALFLTGHGWCPVHWVAARAGCLASNHWPRTTRPLEADSYLNEMKWLFIGITVRNSKEYIGDHFVINTCGDLVDVYANELLSFKFYQCCTWVYLLFFLIYIHIYISISISICVCVVIIWVWITETTLKPAGESGVCSVLADGCDRRQPDWLWKVPGFTFGCTFSCVWSRYVHPLHIETHEFIPYTTTSLGIVWGLMRHCGLRASPKPAQRLSMETCQVSMEEAILTSLEKDYILVCFTSLWFIYFNLQGNHRFKICSS